MADSLDDELGNDLIDAFTFSSVAPDRPPTVKFLGQDVATFDANQVLAVHPTTLLLVFVPLMRNGGTEDALERAARAIRAEVHDEREIAEFVTALASLAIWSVPGDRVRAVIRRVFGSDDMLAPTLTRHAVKKMYYEAIIAVLRDRFETLPDRLNAALERADEATLAMLLPFALQDTLDQFGARLGIQLA